MTEAARSSIFWQNWHESGKPGAGIPQLNFHCSLSYPSAAYRYDVPFGTIKRESLDIDVPGNSWAIGFRRDNNKLSIMLISQTKYGFRGTDNSLALSLIRGSFDPDPYP